MTGSFYFFVIMAECFDFLRSFQDRLADRALLARRASLGRAGSSDCRDDLFSMACGFDDSALDLVLAACAFLIRFLTGCGAGGCMTGSFYFFVIMAEGCDIFCLSCSANRTCIGLNALRCACRLCCYFAIVPAVICLLNM